jgi:tRNA pseudouridine38-40 synthase
MAEHSVQLVLHYDGAGFAGWQRQPETRTVQGVLEAALTRLCNRETKAIGAGRTDAGVHARGQAVGAVVPEAWPAGRLRRALNAILPQEIWVAAAYDMAPEFHARYSALARRYSYRIGIAETSRSPFRQRYEWYVEDRLDGAVLRDAADAIRGEHCFRAYAVRGTAPDTDDHRCEIAEAHWCDALDGGAVIFEIEANRFLHHMVRFLVGTMVDAARGRRDPGDVARLLTAQDNSDTSAPAPAHALVLERVTYPADLYVNL